ncbi:anti-sigma factor [Rossellomorea marisflavi]|jgi:anti-sigma factor RsiW|uniref:Anti-sigma-W factor RsiW n=1 Tax=Rossellomorea marisflavi TaxID=189381 RepID=A0A0M0GM27_9BACI|nr:anti-sigma factor [Rossellomorea marisflavi]KON90547.1 anti-sigma W factor [Rossellomorea marisflavi]MCM2591923.1 anti-sigma factor [Rossellomorea marisflavi]MDR4938813.1 anti-sigma factor [Rossellomorea marisflavi]UTE72794.1 anti-sigma factor [Rossellomorea marisflavi]GLI84127.1 anti-sigma-W factor RsiW [Rossellomorea marisflavi]
MKACPEEVIEYMHDYLDGDIGSAQASELKKHLQECDDCQHHFHELKKAIAFVQSTSHISAPSGFTDSVMARLPKEKKKVGFQRWLKSHPLITAAALFLTFMTGGLFTSWNGNDDFSFTKHDNLVVQDHTVLVPKGEVVKGDLTVRNGDVKIEGKVTGDVTVINGDKYLASAGSVTGDINEIDEAFGWLWYKIKEGVKGTMDLGNSQMVEN